MDRRRRAGTATYRVDQGPGQVERWALAATLFGGRIAASVAMRSCRVLADDGVRTLADADTRSREELVALLDRGGSARYDFRTATRPQELAAALGEQAEARISKLVEGAGSFEEPSARLDELPSWGPVAVALFLCELRGAIAHANPRWIRARTRPLCTLARSAMRIPRHPTSEPSVGSPERPVSTCATSRPAWFCSRSRTAAPSARVRVGRPALSSHELAAHSGAAQGSLGASSNA